MDSETIAKAEKIADQARKSISEYCMKECNSFCCRKGYLILKPGEVDLVSDGRALELIGKGILKKMENGDYSLFMGCYDIPCPSFKEGKCSIHNKRKRPRTCREFPIFINDDYIRFSPRCPAVKEGKLYPYEKKLMALGFKLMKSDTYGEIDLYSVNLNS